MLSSLFKKKKKESSSVLSVDIHSHLLPGLDDGVKTYDESMEIINEMMGLGYKKIITTPHIMQDQFNNSAETILPKLEELRELVRKEGMDVELEAAAEYYMDDGFISMLEDPSHEMLSFGKDKKYLLFETSYINEPAFLTKAIFEIITKKNLIPVMAHPERYVYLQNKPELISTLVERQVLFQININSMGGYYSKSAQKLADRFIKKGLVSFLGSDCHNMKHLENHKTSRQTAAFKKIVGTKLLNNSLL